MSTRVEAHVKNLLSAPTLLAIGVDPVKGEAYLLIRNGNGPTIKKKVPLTAQLNATLMMARSLLTCFAVAFVAGTLSGCYPYRWHEQELQSLEQTCLEQRRVCNDSLENVRDNLATCIQMGRKSYADEATQIEASARGAK